MAVIKGTITSERIDGTDAADRIFGDGGADLIYGGLGNDELFGGRGSDRLFGGAGRDALDGGIGVDRLYGGDGDDLLNGDGDAYGDLLWGGAGDDVAQVGAGDFVDGGAGDDLLIIDGVDADFAIVNVDFSKVSGAATASIGIGGIKARGVERVDVWIDDAGAGSTLRGTEGADTLQLDMARGAQKGATIYGGGGDDTIYGSELADVLDGGAGDDIIYALEGRDSVRGGAGSDLFVVDLSERFPDAFTVQDFSSADFFYVPAYNLPGSWEDNLENTGRYFDLDNLLVAKAAPAATSWSAQFLYDTRTGAFSFDEDGRGSLAPIHLATLTGAPALTADNILFGF
ncbi:hypothetical protein GCM10008171_15490 [Methylopila jiangsuensis]|uniref:Hemolysin-type calcium-binding repeat-containing protein n=1 Tax=Methylopila jiangsuensis TaxID=586230 RepID=A0A9W6JI78_9HYPH|nr:calcium-binding protein [Methylopila jiangsuensis]MDR6284187.1 Ca2+-binding RTX toxin-like protein [Methylopila jiangsuensis]GLK76295.1 hypothetical protein GCM10008171_15490 [Methylopila jiangsuensis]